MKVASVCRCLPAKTRMTLSSGTPGPGPSIEDAVRMREPGRGREVGGPRADPEEDVDEVYDMTAEADCTPGHMWAGLLEAKKGND